MIDIHLLDLQMQIKEMRRRQAAIHQILPDYYRENPAGARTSKLRSIDLMSRR